MVHSLNKVPCVQLLGNQNIYFIDHTPETYMEATRDQQIGIVCEGLRLVSACKVPPFHSAVDSDQLRQMQHEWSGSLWQTLPPLLDWVGQHRQTLFDEEWGPATLGFQQFFVLVYIEQTVNMDNVEFQLNGHDESAYPLRRRLIEFRDDVERIITKEANTDLRASLFHYHERSLRFRGWKCLPVELYSFYQLFRVLWVNPVDMNLLFGQRIMLLAVKLGKELLGFQQSLEHQKMGLKLLDIVMDAQDSEPSYTEDAEEILKMTLPLSRQVADTGYDYQLWNIIYKSIRTIRDANSALYDEIIQTLVALLNEQIIAKNPTVFYGDGSYAYLSTLTLLLLLDVPDVEVDEHDFEAIIISGCLSDWNEFLTYSRVHLQSKQPGNLRISIDLRLRIGQLIPKLFSGSFIIDYFLESYNKCLEVLTWVTLFPIGQTEQQQLARGFMLKRLLNNMKRLCENVVKDRSHCALDQSDVHTLYDKLRGLLRLILQGIEQLPDGARFRKLKWNLKRHMGATHVEMKRLKALVIREDPELEELEQ